MDALTDIRTTEHHHLLRVFRHRHEIRLRRYREFVHRYESSFHHHHISPMAEKTTTLVRDLWGSTRLNRSCISYISLITGQPCNDTGAGNPIVRNGLRLHRYRLLRKGKMEPVQGRY